MMLVSGKSIDYCLTLLYVHTILSILLADTYVVYYSGVQVLMVMPIDLFIFALHHLAALGLILLMVTRYYHYLYSLLENS